MLFSFGRGRWGRLGLGANTRDEWAPQLVTASVHSTFGGKVLSMSAGVECSVVCAGGQLYVAVPQHRHERPRGLCVPYFHGLCATL